MHRLSQTLPALRARCVSAAFLLSVLSARADRTVALAWDPHPDPSVVGFHAIVLEGPFSEPRVVDVPVPATSADFSGLHPGDTYRFFVTAYRADTSESDPSDVITITIPADSAPAPLTAPMGLKRAAPAIDTSATRHEANSTARGRLRRARTPKSRPQRTRRHPDSQTQ